MYSRPFIYIAALMRTGSTVLSEALTQLPYAFVFREPHLGKNDFRLKQDDIARFGPRGQKLAAFAHLRLPLAFCLRRLRAIGYPQDYLVKQFKRHLFPQLGVQQVGVKEIKNQGWHNYHKHFPGMKVVITARDPRDIYLSLYHRVRKGNIQWSGPLTPARVSQALLAEFDYQQQIRQTCDAILVRYEDLCTDDKVYERIKKFVQSPIPGSLPVARWWAKIAHGGLIWGVLRAVYRAFCSKTAHFVPPTQERDTTQFLIKEKLAPSMHGTSAVQTNISFMATKSQIYGLIVGSERKMIRW